VSRPELTPKDRAELNGAWAVLGELLEEVREARESGTKSMTAKGADLKLIDLVDQPFVFMERAINERIAIIKDTLAGEEPTTT
jgi:hypothetical protein